MGTYHYLIINSDSLIDKAIAYLEALPAGFMVRYPHNDESGQRTYAKLGDFLADQGWMGSNRAHLYPGFKYWTQAREEQLGLSKPSVRLGSSSIPQSDP